MSLKELSQNKDAMDQLLLLMRRSVAENKAKAVLEASRKVVDADVVDVLQSWVTRLNGLHNGQTFVFSDHGSHLGPLWYTLPSATYPALAQYAQPAVFPASTSMVADTSVPVDIPAKRGLSASGVEQV